MKPPRELWAEAFRSLTPEEKSQIPWHNAASPAGISELIDLTKAKQTQCQAKSWKFKVAGREVILRDVAAKIITWLHKFREVGDVVVQYDPGHAALPWAAVRMLLQLGIAESEQMGIILEIVEISARLVLQCRVYETINVPEANATEAECFNQLKSDIVTLYRAILRCLIRAHGLLSVGVGRRAIRAIFKPEVLEGLVEEIDQSESRLLTQLGACKLYMSYRDRADIEAHIQNMAAPLYRVEDSVSNVLQSVRRDEQLRILEWCSSIPYGSHHQVVSGQRTEGTGQWLLQHPKFKEWHDTSYSSLLLLHGAPGAGKTFLASAAIDHVKEYHRNNTTDEAFAYFYCNRNEGQRRDPEWILRSLIRQLYSTGSYGNLIHQDLYAAYTELKLQSRHLDIKECEKLLWKIIHTYPTTTIFLDALDECEMDSRECLLGVFSRHFRDSPRPLKLFISSRSNPDILAHFDLKNRIEIQATDNAGDIIQGCRQINQIRFGHKSDLN